MSSEHLDLAWLAGHAYALRGLLAESMGYEGCHRVCKDYLQPLLKMTAFSLPVFLSMSDRQRTAVVVGSVYLVLYLLSSVASRKAGYLTEKLGSEERSSRCLWMANLLMFIIMCAGILSGCTVLAIIPFVGLTMLQN